MCVFSVKLSCVYTADADKTRQFCLVFSCVHTADTDKTKLSCLVHFRGVNTTADKARQLCLVSSCVQTTDTDQTRQFCLVCVSGVNKPLHITVNIDHNCNSVRVVIKEQRVEWPKAMRPTVMGTTSH